MPIVAVGFVYGYCLVQGPEVGQNQDRGLSSCLAWPPVNCRGSVKLARWIPLLHYGSRDVHVQPANAFPKFLKSKHELFGKQAHAKCSLHPFSVV